MKRSLTATITLKPGTFSYFVVFGVFPLDLLPAIVSSFYGGRSGVGSCDVSGYTFLFVHSSEMSIEDRSLHDSDFAPVL